MPSSSPTPSSPRPSFTSKDERQYEHVKESELERGRAEEDAKRIAGATVNKQRAKEGRTMSASTKRSGGSSASGASKKKTPGRRAGR